MLLPSVSFGNTCDGSDCIPLEILDFAFCLSHCSKIRQHDTGVLCDICSQKVMWDLRMLPNLMTQMTVPWYLETSLRFVNPSQIPWGNHSHSCGFMAQRTDLWPNKKFGISLHSQNTFPLGPDAPGPPPFPFGPPAHAGHWTSWSICIPHCWGNAQYWSTAPKASLHADRCSGLLNT